MIPVYSPLFLGNEKKYLQQCIDSRWVSSEGYFVKKFEEAFAKWAGTTYAVAVCNGTAALETALFSCDIRQTLYIPNNTIISCVIAAKRQGLDYILYNNNLYGSSQMFEHKAVMRCHLFGHFDDIKSYNVVIDDASQYWEPFKVKDVACYSLFANKLITSGEGGILTTNKKNIYDKAVSFRNLAHTTERFIHSHMAYNFRLSNLQAAVALAQLEKINTYIRIKQKNRELYKKYLPSNVKILFDVKVPWMYLICIKRNAGDIIIKLKIRGIEARRFFYPLSEQPCINSISMSVDYNPWHHFLYLPSGLDLTEKQIKYICQSLKTSLSSTT